MRFGAHAIMKLVIYLVCIAALALAASIFSGSGPVAQWPGLKVAVIAIAVVAGMAAWWLIARRRRREKLQQLRDSALW